jgi:hypothetical protein
VCEHIRRYIEIKGAFGGGADFWNSIECGGDFVVARVKMLCKTGARSAEMRCLCRFRVVVAEGVDS